MRKRALSYLCTSNHADGMATKRLTNADTRNEDQHLLVLMGFDTQTEPKGSTIPVSLVKALITALIKSLNRSLHNTATKSLEYADVC